MASFTGLNAQVLGISVDHIPCLQSWAESLGGITYPLLSDFWPHGEVAELYGVLRKAEGHSERAIFVIDRKGYIRYIDIHDISDRPDNEVLRNVLKDLEAELIPPRPAVTTTPHLIPLLKDEEPETTPLPAGEAIILYCARWCKDCRKAKAWLDERGMQYVEVDIDYDMAARSRVRQWGNGFLITPVLDVYGTVVLDFDVPKIEEALRKHEAE